MSMSCRVELSSGAYLVVPDTTAAEEAERYADNSDLDFIDFALGDDRVAIVKPRSVLGFWDLKR